MSHADLGSPRDVLSARRRALDSSDKRERVLIQWFRAMPQVRTGDPGPVRLARLQSYKPPPGFCGAFGFLGEPGLATGLDAAGLGVDARFV